MPGSGIWRKRRKLELPRAGLWLLGADRSGDRFWQRLRAEVADAPPLAPPVAADSGGLMVTDATPAAQTEALRVAHDPGSHRVAAGYEADWLYAFLAFRPLAAGFFALADARLGSATVFVAAALRPSPIFLASAERRSV